jgi:hypothetical protein
MNSKSAALVGSLVGALVTMAGGCLELKAPNSGPTGGSGGSAGSGEGGAGGGQASSSNSSSGQAGVGGGGSCAPGEVQACYPGPPETENTGACVAGEMSCSDGTWNACAGVVLPNLEPCNAIIDMNCDGSVGCTGGSRSGQALGTGEDDFIAAIATGIGSNGYDGPVYGVGYRSGVLAADGTPDSAEVLFMVRNLDGQLADWSSKFNIAAAGHTYVTGVAGAPNNDIVFVGVYENGSLSINGTALKPTTARIGFLGVFTPAGTTQFTKTIESSNGVHLNDVGVDSSGNIFVSGRFMGTLDFGDGNVSSIDGWDGFVVSYTSTGAFRWKRMVAGSGDESVEALAVDTFGAPYVVTKFTGNLTIDGMGFGVDGGSDALVTALDATNGKAIWNEHISGAGEQHVVNIAARADNIALLTNFRGGLVMGPATYNNLEQAPLWDMAIATIDSATGNIQQSVAFSALGLQVGYGIVIDSFGDLIVDGYFSSSLPVPGGPTLNSDPNDTNAFAIKLDSTFTARWAHDYGDDQIQAFTDVAIGTTTGHVFVGGGFRGTLSGFATSPQSSGGYDAFIGELSN